MFCASAFKVATINVHHSSYEQKNAPIFPQKPYYGDYLGTLNTNTHTWFLRSSTLQMMATSLI